MGAGAYAGAGAAYGMGAPSYLTSATYPDWASRTP